MSISAKWLNKVKWDEVGLVPVITQEVGSNDVLMFAWMNREALARTVEIGQAVYWSRSRKKLWHKGEESGHFQKVHEIRLDCDEDVVLLKVEQVAGIACHTGRHSCFFQKFDGSADNGEWLTVEPVLKDLPPGAGGAPVAKAEKAADKPRRTRKTADAAKDTEPGKSES
ncbi:phosphoribosyl-AMP cyclohydrolase [Herbaspirillum sp. SJZ130]|nr:MULTISPECIES: phosphoribosyl-AMP cyclohydrolase [unclassified Herbaspirillum]MBB5390394.1 phosphoribosyl-AMP cyclohydrolase [Herbaspirillum sp. SJZ102]TQK09109.1 phosphoribosyl-AMP cyclohydrolase [Herbaspirillum sp. SJZ130]TQK14204.1 phosphoribosyl-AMP cyclohydrolase [Herbaspirillum sp. SJZ106]TWC69903.1 phosphoribosyl-AMP cyclohydrolase [Herbaspirillum sp. SJZ099]